MKPVSNKKVVKKFVTKPIATAAIVLIAFFGCVMTALATGDVDLTNIVIVGLILTIKGTIVMAFYNGMLRGSGV